MIGVLVNGGAIVAGSLAGILFKKAMNEELNDALMKAFALIILYLGFSGATVGTNITVELLSLTIGCAIGTLLDLDGRFNRFSDKLGKKISRKDEPGGFAVGFVNGTVIFCVGAVAIMGALEAGLTGETTLLFAKAVLDFIVAMIMASTMGIGVAFAALAVILYEGFFVIVSAAAEPYLSEYVVNEISCVGFLAVVAIGFNIMGITKIKVVNLIPAVFIPIVLCLFIK